MSATLGRGDPCLLEMRLVLRGLSVAAPFVWRCPNTPTLTPFQIPLIEPDRQISRMRLSDKTSRLRTRQVHNHGPLRGTRPKCP